MKKTILIVTVLIVAAASNFPVGEFVADAATQWGTTRLGCQAYTEALVDRAHFVLRAVTTSRAFRECADARLGTRYKNCDDPNGSDARTVQIAKVLKAIERNNPLEYTCSYALNYGSSAKANYAPWGEHGVKTIDLADDWMESFSDWSRSPRRAVHGGRMLLDGSTHTPQATHKHPDSGCPADYKAGGIEPSAPYIIGDCVANVIEESAAVCSIFGAPTGALSLVTHLKENTSGTQTCETVFDPGLRVALRTSGGQYLRAVNGGGTVIDAQATARRTVGNGVRHRYERRTPVVGRIRSYQDEERPLSGTVGRWQSRRCHAGERPGRADVQHQSSGWWDRENRTRRPGSIAQRRQLCHGGEWRRRCGHCQPSRRTRMGDIYDGRDEAGECGATRDRARPQDRRHSSGRPAGAASVTTDEPSASG